MQKCSHFPWDWPHNTLRPCPYLCCQSDYLCLATYDFPFSQGGLPSWKRNISHVSTEGIRKWEKREPHHLNSYGLRPLSVKIFSSPQKNRYLFPVLLASGSTLFLCQDLIFLYPLFLPWLPMIWKILSANLPSNNNHFSSGLTKPFVTECMLKLVL